MQPHAENHSHHDDALESRDERLFYLTHELQVAPRHYVQRRERHHGGFQHGSETRRVVSDVGRRAGR